MREKEDIVKMVADVVGGGDRILAFETLSYLASQKSLHQQMLRGGILHDGYKSLVSIVFSDVKNMERFILGATRI